MSFKKREAEKVRPWAYIATPAYDGKVNSEYALSLAQGMQALALYGINATAAVMGNGAFIDLARNAFVRMFLQTECTHLFFIDADLEFEPHAMAALITANEPICAGMYRRRQEPEDYPCRWVSAPDGGGLWVKDNRWLLCDRVPTGFMCIRRDVVEAMAAESVKLNLPGKNEKDTPRLFYTFVNDDNAFVGEDFAFCEDYRKKYNKPIPVLMDLKFKHGGMKCNFHDYLAREIDKEKQREANEKANPSGMVETFLGQDIDETSAAA
jgi:hypothetical protein